MHHPIAFHAEMMGNIMYFRQALQQPDDAEFLKLPLSQSMAILKTRHGN
jgi:hypothetical protein